LRLAHAPEDVQAFVEEKPDSLRVVVYLLEIETEAERAPVIKGLLQKTLKTEDLLEPLQRTFLGKMRVGERRPQGSQGHEALVYTSFAPRYADV
jgi:hypothetical protein